MTVYQPAEDTFLVIEYLDELDLEGKKFLEIGTGSGEIALKAREKGAEVTAVDINTEAVEHARQRAESEGLEIEIFQSDLFENVDGEYDFIVFNPPYLPGEEGVGDEEIWRGGESGVEILERFLAEATDHLAENGAIIFVASSLADLDQVDLEDFDTVSTKKLWFEDLYLFRSK